MTRRLLASLLLYPAMAAGQAADTPPAPPHADPPAPAPLAGPPVSEERIDGVESGFSMMGPARERMSDPVPMDIFQQAVAELASEAIPEPERLTPRQIRQLRQIRQDHRKAIEGWRAQHRDEIRQLRAAIGPPAPRPDEAAQPTEMAEQMGEQPQRPPRRDPQRALARDDLTTAQRAAIARLAELRAESPSGAALQTKIWAELTPAQQERVQSRIDEHRARVAEQRQEAYIERFMARREAPSDRPTPAETIEQLPADLRATFDELPAPLRRRLAQMPPERLEQALRRLAALTPEQRADALERMRKNRAKQ